MTQSIRGNGSGPAWKIPGSAHSTISGIAIGLQLIIFVAWASTGRNSHFVLWCLVLALDAGITCGIFGLCWARSWRARLFAFTLLWINALSLVFLLFAALLNKVMPGVFEPIIGG
jgi:hypothetical protein